MGKRKIIVTVRVVEDDCQDCPHGYKTKHSVTCTLLGGIYPKTLEDRCPIPEVCPLPDKLYFSDEDE